MDNDLIVPLILVFVAAFLGGLLTAILGFITAHAKGEGFDVGKFLESVVKSFLGACVIAYGYYKSGISIPDTLFLALLAGAGIDAGIKRVSDVIASSINKKTT